MTDHSGEFFFIWFLQNNASYQDNDLIPPPLQGSQLYVLHSDATNYSFKISHITNRVYFYKNYIYVCIQGMIKTNNITI